MACSGATREILTMASDAQHHLRGRLVDNDDCPDFALPSSPTVSHRHKTPRAFTTYELATHCSRKIYHGIGLFKNSCSYPDSCMFSNPRILQSMHSTFCKKRRLSRVRYPFSQTINLFHPTSILNCPIFTPSHSLSSDSSPTSPCIHDTTPPHHL